MVEVKKDNILIVNRLMRAVKGSGHANIVADGYDKGQNISFREMRKKKNEQHIIGGTGEINLL